MHSGFAAPRLTVGGSVRASSWKLGQKRPDTMVVDMGTCGCSGAGRLLCRRAMLLLMRFESARSCVQHQDDALV